MEIAQAQGMMEHLGGEEKAQLDKTFTQLKNLDSDLFSGFARTDDGIQMSEKGLEDLKTNIENAKVQFEKLMKEL